MPDKKSKSVDVDAAGVPASAPATASTGPSSAPELTDAQKQRIESELSVTSAKTPAPSAVASATGSDGPGAALAADNSSTASAVGSDIATSSSDTAATTDAEQKAVSSSESTARTASDGPPDESDDSGLAALAHDKPPTGRIRRFFSGFGRHKIWTSLFILAIIGGGLAAVPYTRYLLAGYVVQHRVEITVVDSATKKQVSSATVTIDGSMHKTDKDGKAVIPAVKPGKHTLTVGKKYYKEASSELFVPLMKDIQKEVTIQATGRQVPVTVVNKISKAPLENATLRALGTEVKTDKDGKALLVLPADKKDVPVTIIVNGFNQLEGRVQITDTEVRENTFAVVPSGKVYFLSRQSGKIDVVKTDLDGGNRQTVVYGTGKEDDRATVLLSSRDWKYLALLSRRDSGLAKLYLIDTSTDKMTVMDEGDAEFSLSGWSDHDFVFTVSRNAAKPWEANKQAVKRYNAEKRQLITLDQTAAQNGDGGIIAYQTFQNFYLLHNELVYTVEWSASFSNGYYSPSLPGGLSDSIRTIPVGGTGNAGRAGSDAGNGSQTGDKSDKNDAKKDVKSMPAEQYSSFNARLYAPEEIYFAAYDSAASANAFFEYEDGVVKPANLDENKFFNSVYPTYLRSPAGNKTFWSEQRDGRDTLFIGDTSGQNGKQIGILDESKVYGWYTDDYLLVSKKGSELYILPVGGGDPLKVADYHKPQLTYAGYGGGYGGL